MTAEIFIRPGEAECTEKLRYDACGLEGIFLCNGYKFETRGGRNFLRISDQEGLHQAIAKHLVLTRKAFSGKEVRFIRTQMNLTQRDLAEKLGTTSQTLARWEKGQVPITGAADRLLRIIFMVSLLSGDQLLELVSQLSSKIEQMDELGLRPAVFNLDNDHHHWSEQLEEAA